MFHATSTLVLFRHSAHTPAPEVVEGLINLRGHMVTTVNRPEGSLVRGECSPLQGKAIGQPASRRGAGRF